MDYGVDPKPEWERLCTIEPKLIDLFNKAKREATNLRNRFRSEPYSRLDKYKVYGRYKQEIGEVAGWQAERDELKTSDAYDMTYWECSICRDSCRF